MKHVRRLALAALVFTFAVAAVAQPRPGGRQRPNRARPNSAPDRLKVGDPAPEFKLKSADGKREVQLSSFKGKRPVVLVFGSYT